MRTSSSVRRSVLGAVLGFGLIVVMAGPAAAHVTIDPGSAPEGSTTKFSFQVPNEKDNASTVGLEVTFPADHPIASVSVLEEAGWSFTIEKQPLPKPIKSPFGGEVTEAVSKITWTGGQIQPGAFDLFTVRAGPLPKNVSKLEFRASQTYSDGEVQWIEPTVKGGDEPEHPAPVMKLTKASGGDSH